MDYCSGKRYSSHYLLKNLIKIPKIAVRAIIIKIGAQKSLRIPKKLVATFATVVVIQDTSPVENEKDPSVDTVAPNNKSITYAIA